MDLSTFHYWSSLIFISGTVPKQNPLFFFSKTIYVAFGLVWEICFVNLLTFSFFSRGCLLFVKNFVSFGLVS